METVMTRAGPFLASFLFLAAPALAQTDAPAPSALFSPVSASTCTLLATLATLVFDTVVEAAAEAA